MQGIEQLIRESLTARAQDVETTPMLWLEVDRRVARRKRFQVTAWSLAGATAALAAVFAVPAIVGLIDGDPRELDIAPIDQTPVAGVVPEFYVTDVDGYLSLFEVGTGEPVATLPDGVDPFAVAADEIEVRPGSTSDEGAVVALRGASSDAPVIEVVTTGTDEDGGRWRETYTHTLPGEGDFVDFRSSVAWTPDQDLVAYTLPTEDQSSLVLWDPTVEAEDGTGVEVAAREVGLVFGIGDVELLDWVGRTAAVGDESVLYFRDDLGVHAQRLELATDGSMVPGASEILDDVHDVASAHAAPGSLDGPQYRLETDGTGELVLTFRRSSNFTSSFQLDGHLDFSDPDALWIDAKQDAVLVGDGARTLLFTHDGDGGWVFRDASNGDRLPYAELESPGPAALFDAPRPGEPEPTPNEPVAEQPAEEPPPEPTQTEEPAPVTGAALPEPVVTATIKDLVLHGPDGEQVLYTLPAEGESSFLSVAVRPDSTVDDLTIVALHLAEGMQDFRTYRYVDGELSVEYWERQDFQPGFGGGSGDAVAAFGPVWHPAGDKLAWIEMGTSGVPNLRIIGWTDDGPGTGNTADDNTSFTLDEFEGIAVEPLEWIDLGGGQTEIRAVAGDFFDQWISIPVEIQADSAAALSGSAEFSSLADGGEGRVGGVAGQNPRWLLQGDTVHLLDDRSVSVTLPPEFFPGEGLPDTWMREIGDGVLVGMSNTGSVYYVSADGELARVGEDAWMTGDVVD
ncbi:MAG: hypothetical protein WD378_07190 [Egicoccus sp.]